MFTELIKSINWDMLNQQKKLLVELIWNVPNSKLWGLVHLIDQLQDTACDSEMWKFPSTEEYPIFHKWKLSGPESLCEGALSWDINENMPYKFNGVSWDQITLEEYRGLLEDRGRTKTVIVEVDRD